MGEAGTELPAGASSDAVDFARAELPGHQMWTCLDGLRERGPLAPTRFGGQPAFVITTRELLLEAFLRVDALPPATLYQNSIAQIIGTNFQSMEGDEHRLHRRLATPAFRSRTVQRYGDGGMRALAEELIERFAEAREADLVAQFTHLFPFLVICRLLGIPRAEEDRFHQWAWEMLGAPSVAPAASQRANTEFTRYLEPVIADRRKQPRDDVISALLEADVEGRRLTDEQVLSNLKLMFAAGATTTCDATGNLLHALLVHPGAWQQVVDDPALQAGAVEEGLRWETPVANLPRISADHPVELGGREIPPSSFVLLSMASANRDPAHIDDPHRFDPSRVPRDTLTFGRGERSCPGMHLAKKEIAVALETLATRFPRLRLAGHADASAPTGALVRGPRQLRVLLH